LIQTIRYYTGGGTHFSSGTNPDSGGTFVAPFKLLKYALPLIKPMMHIEYSPNFQKI